MEKVIVVALLLVNVQFIVATCSSETASACGSGYNACVMAAGTSSDQLCNCFGAYSICLLNNDCINATSFQDLVGNCEASGCTAQQCTGSVLAPVDAPSYAPTTSAPVTQPGCDSTTCINNYYACTNGSADGFCGCYGDYLSCLYNVGCLTQGEYENATQSCEQYGCSTQQCTGGALAPVDAPSYAPTDAPAGCFASCLSTYNTCANNNGSAGYCSCYGEYLACIYYAGCYSLNEYQIAIQSCEQLGCTAQQCTAQNVPASSSPGSTPVASNGPVSSCSASQATVCANEYTSCVQEAGTDLNAICNCYGPYYMCLYDIGCLGASQYQYLVQSCVQSGCSLQQCAWNSTVISPVSEPTSSTPSSSSVPVSAPVSAPFVPPTTVICLQPWELVLIAVGSVLAGIGLAAIVGVIIYLSRRSSAKKTSTKYAKLQNY